MIKAAVIVVVLSLATGQRIEVKSVLACTDDRCRVEATTGRRYTIPAPVVVGDELCYQQDGCLVGWRSCP